MGECFFWEPLRFGEERIVCAMGGGATGAASVCLPKRNSRASAGLCSAGECGCCFFGLLYFGRYAWLTGLCEVR